VAQSRVLTEVLMGLVYNAFGTIGLKLLKFGCAAGIVCSWLSHPGNRCAAMLEFTILFARA